MEVRAVVAEAFHQIHAQWEDCANVANKYTNMEGFAQWEFEMTQARDFFNRQYALLETNEVPLWYQDTVVKAAEVFSGVDAHIFALSFNEKFRSISYEEFVELHKNIPGVTTEQLDASWAKWTEVIAYIASSNFNSAYKYELLADYQKTLLEARSFFTRNVSYQGQQFVNYAAAESVAYKVDYTKMTTE